MDSEQQDRIRDEEVETPDAGGGTGAYPPVLPMPGGEEESTAGGTTGWDLEDPQAEVAEERPTV